MRPVPAPFLHFMPGTSSTPHLPVIWKPLIESTKIPLWIHGHTHFNVDYAIGSTRIVSNQRGYPMERSAGFNARVIVEV